mgnify:CR=1 FL=1
MPAIFTKLNYKNIVLEHDTRYEEIGVVLRTGGVRYIRWLGFIDVSSARSLRGGVPVKLVAAAYRSEILFSRIDLEPGQYVQGFLVNDGVYGVLVDGTPRIIG